MADVEKVLKGLEQCSKKRTTPCDKRCPYYHEDFCESELAKDALELMKEYQQLQGWASGHGLTKCMDCKYYSGQFCNLNDIYPWPKDDWFCADGERK